MIRLLLFLLAALPQPSTQFKQLPPGAGKAQVEAACYQCHAADLLASSASPKSNGSPRSRR
ncbi:MAG TPA: hypothetical protein VEO54_10160 [Thermoanaerobaculia bacterium]|nr:hypothetical protein [Thermoanaerobaculia bacterium]